MTFAENLSPFYADFGESVTVNGMAVTGFFDKPSADAFNIAQEYRATLRVMASVSAAVGQAVVRGAENYTITAIDNADFSGAEKILSLK